MAEFFGLDIPTPEEIREAERAEQLAQINQRTGWSQLGTALGVNLSRGFRGKSPEEQKAEDLQKQILDANTAADDAPGDLTDLERRQIFLRKAIASLSASGDTRRAMQATQEMVANERTIEERRRLLSAESRAEAAEKRLAALHPVEMSRQGTASARERFMGQFMVQGPDGNPTGFGNFLDAESLPTIRDAAQKGYTIVTLAGLMDANEKKIAEEATNDDRPVEERQFLKEVRAALPFVRVAGDLKSFLLANPNANTVGTQVRGFLQNMAAQGQSLVMETFGSDAVRVDAQNFDAWFNEETAKNPAMANAQMKAMVSELAYAIASSREGGRLTDQDVERAAQVFAAGVPDPKIIIDLLDDQIRRKNRDINDAQVALGVTNDKDVQNSLALFNTRIGDYGKVGSAAQERNQLIQDILNR